VGFDVKDLTGVGAIFDFGSKLIDKLFPDKIKQESERAQALIALSQMQQTGEIEMLKQSLSAILAEAQSTDPWTSRARPSFLYVIYVMILASIPMGVLHAVNPALATGIAEGMKAWLSAIPDELYVLFGAGYLGYAHYRTSDKKFPTKK
jgi:hypothetical protein